MSDSETDWLYGDAPKPVQPKKVPAAIKPKPAKKRKQR